MLCKLLKELQDWPRSRPGIPFKARNRCLLDAQVIGKLSLGPFPIIAELFDLRTIHDVSI